MITPYPVTFGVDPAARGVARPVRTTLPSDKSDSLHYHGGRRSRSLLVIGAVASIGIHLALLFGFDRKRPEPVAVKGPENIIALTLTPPLIQELEEPEPIPGDETGPPPDLATLVPMQADLPQLPSPTDFVQQINFTSLLERPDFKDLTVNVIPDNFRGGRKLAESIGNIFNLAELDRIPEPILQPSPIFPIAMKRDALTATVYIEFIVDSGGKVVGAFVINSTNSGFDAAALSGVARWRFRPGTLHGRKVNTRMRVPIAFEYHDSD